MCPHMQIGTLVVYLGRAAGAHEVVGRGGGRVASVFHDSTLLLFSLPGFGETGTGGACGCEGAGVLGGGRSVGEGGSGSLGEK